MNSKEIHALSEKHDDEYLKFDRIPVEKQLHRNDDLCGFLKLFELSNTAETNVFHHQGEHDQIYLASPESMPTLTEDDIVYLLRCGISYNGNVGCFYCFC